MSQLPQPYRGDEKKVTTISSNSPDIPLVAVTSVSDESDLAPLQGSTSNFAEQSLPIKPASLGQNMRNSVYSAGSSQTSLKLNLEKSLSGASVLWPLASRVSTTTSGRPYREELQQDMASILEHGEAREGNGGSETPSGSMIPKVRPVVDAHDRLWADIDVLDDVEDMAYQTEINESFFGKEHAEVLEKLRQAQANLVDQMVEGENRIEKSQYQIVWEHNDIDAIRRNLFDQQQFDNISHHVDLTISKLDQVADFMKDVDQKSKEMWKTSH